VLFAPAARSLLGRYGGELSLWNVYGCDSIPCAESQKAQSATRSNLKLFADNFFCRCQPHELRNYRLKVGWEHSRHSPLAGCETIDRRHVDETEHPQVNLFGVSSRYTKSREENSWISRSGLNLFRHRDKQQHSRVLRLKRIQKTGAKGSLRFGHIWCVLCFFFRSARSPSSPLCLARERAASS
jgi:hypothetical protein